MKEALAFCDQCMVADRAICAALTGTEREELVRHGRRKRYSRGDTIIAAGDSNDNFATLIRGAAKIASIDADGTERIVALAHPAGMLGQLFSPGADLHVIALTDSEACLFPRDRIEALVHDHPRMAARLLQETSNALADARGLIDLISKRKSSARVAALLIEFAHAASAAPCHPAEFFELPLSRGEMAQLLGITIETVSRSITAMERDALIERHGAHGIRILDRDGLARLIG
ncbi:Crp/Fnr family transcriptional regulator [Stakelama pacifica]|uniref:Crp/Fnr family transcriptional regulator n=1 Tax=Stakelama pacifica TaxID=517720 RepID=A0A4R6F9P8_9SPHN|nr:Crp/Fnr family transcriptional regulator [Stakelama pacifica]TDN77796.1 Crp/Fnr family transcriptional regulator [Stakelama pacifica]GGP00794.1 transcriptional regulator [Stakelama pacifica]